jgi:hydroxymethylglutaryl-CoA synthase
LAAILDIAKAGDRIFVTAYGSGAGSDSFSITATDLLEERRRFAPPVKYYLERRSYLDYSSYARYKRLFKGE